MSVTRDHELPPPVLPELEQILVRAARRRAAPRLSRRRWVLAVAVGALVLAAAAAAAATGVLDITSGRTAHGTFTVERAILPGREADGSICLQLRYDGGDPFHGCGEAPTAARSFGLVVADPLAEGSTERVVYGLVTSDVRRVGVVSEGGEQTEADTEAKEGLPGRFFAIVVPHLGRVALVGYDAAGKETARIGGLAQPTHAPLSKAEAAEQGDPAGFAPTAPAAGRFIFRGRSIGEAEVDRLKLSCVEGRRVDHCYRSMAELEDARGEHRPPDRYSYRGRPIPETEVDRLNLSCISGDKVNRCFDSAGEADEAARSEH